MPTEDDPDWNFGSGGGSGAGENPPVEEGEEFKVKNELIDPCASLIFNELLLLSMDHNLPPEVAYNSMNGLQTDLHFSTAILDLFNGSKKFDYIVNKDASLAANTNAQTHYPAVYNPITEKYKITTSFNPDYFEEATDLSMARTMIHESVHAYLIYVLRGEPLGNMKEALDAYIDKNEFPNTFDNQLNHNFMAQFVNAMAYQLQLWDHHHGTGGNLDWQYYQDMAWGGLTKNPENPNSFYDEFENYLDLAAENSDNESRNEIKLRILSASENEKQNTSDSSQNGNKNNCQ